MTVARFSVILVHNDLLSNDSYTFLILANTHCHLVATAPIQVPIYGRIGGEFSAKLSF